MKCIICGKEFVPKPYNRKVCYEDHHHKCPVCGKDIICNDPKRQNCACSRKCGQILGNESRKQSNLQKYGVENVSQLDSIKKVISDKQKELHPKQPKRYKICEVCGKEFELKWPYDQHTCSPECRGKFRKMSGISRQVYTKASETNRKRYGVANQGQRAEVQEKMGDSMQSNYGVRHALQSEELLEKRHQTYLHKYGVNHSSQHPDVKEKQRQTMLERYGVENYFKSETNIVNNMSDPSKIESWISFKSDPVSFISSNFSTPPNIYQLCECLGVTDTRIYDILIENGARDLIKHYSSFMEVEIIDFIHSIDSNIRIERNNRKLIAPYELDIYLPDYRLAFECNPAITHNSSLPDQFGGKPKPRNYHKMKTDMCDNIGLQLFHIFGYEWKFKKSIICSMIRNLLGRSSKIHARNTYVDIATYKETKEFLNNNHRQGFASYSYSICLRCRDSEEIVSMMTFGKMRISQGRKTDDDQSLELVRFCNKLNTSVVGGASKLFSYFINLYGAEFTKVVSFSDRSHTSGHLYEVLGFNKVSSSEPGYCWVNRSSETMYSRVQCQKRNLRKLFDDDSIDIEHKTEREIMLEHGYVQVFDSGVIRWEYTKKP